MQSATPRFISRRSSPGATTPRRSAARNPIPGRIPVERGIFRRNPQRQGHRVYREDGLCAHQGAGNGKDTCPRAEIDGVAYPVGAEKFGQGKQAALCRGVKPGAENYPGSIRRESSRVATGFLTFLSHEGPPVSSTSNGPRRHGGRNVLPRLIGMQY